MKLDFISNNGDRLPLVGNPLFAVTYIDGLTKTANSVSSAVIGGVDGDKITNVQAQPRPIIIDMQIRGGVNVEFAKREILKVVKTKQTALLEWHINDKIMQISGTVESINMPRFSDAVTMQITLHCEPFWEDTNIFIQEINEAISLHYFTETEGDMLFFPDEGIPLGEYDYSRTRNFENAGDVETGFEIEIVAFDTVTNPIIYGENGQFFGIGYGNGNQKVVLQAGDILRINTNRGKKSIIKNGVTNLLNKFKPGGTWLQLKAGQNSFSIDAEESSTENMTFFLSYVQKYV